MLLHRKTAIFALTLCGLLSGGSQFLRRTVDGMVTDKRGNPLPGAAVQLENTLDLSVRSYITQQDGRYYFNGLSDDIDYTLRARYFNHWSNQRTVSKFDSSLHPKVNLVVPVD